MIRNTAFLLCKGIRIGYISDVHTEVNHLKSLEYVGNRNCDVLVLAGDIGDPFAYNNSYKRFLEACTGIAKHTLVLAGNHEYYQSNRYSMAQTKTKISTLCTVIGATNDSKSECGTIRFMDNSVFTYHIPSSKHSIRFICSTLWSDISREQEKQVCNGVNDYKRIMGFTPERSRELFKRSSAFINESLSSLDSSTHSSDSTRVTTDIVVTHHAPTTIDVSNPKFTGSPLSSAFSSDFKYDPSKRPPYAWIFGHTHHNVARYDRNLNTTLLSNQVGYPGEDCGLACGPDTENVNEKGSEEQ
jgi:predicted phosphodiesterase